MPNAMRVSSCSEAGAYSLHWSSVKPFANRELRRRERPVPLAGVQETVILQVIVVVRNQDGEQYAKVQLRQLRKGFRVRAAHRAEPVGDVGVEARVAFARLKQGLRGHVVPVVPPPVLARLSVEALDERCSQRPIGRIACCRCWVHAVTRRRTAARCARSSAGSWTY